VDAIAGEAQVLVGIARWSRFDDDSGAVSPRAEVTEVAGVKQALYGLCVGILSLLLGHRWSPLLRLAADS
jgi:hypothetical protein